MHWAAMPSNETASTKILKHRGTVNTEHLFTTSHTQGNSAISVPLCFRFPSLLDQTYYWARHDSKCGAMSSVTGDEVPSRPQTASQSRPLLFHSLTCPAGQDSAQVTSNKTAAMKVLKHRGTESTEPLLSRSLSSSNSAISVPLHS